ncbi:MAG TPA: SMI1/KNR4 family protein [Candidatus Saccharimonadales bacterium]
MAEHASSVEDVRAIEKELGVKFPAEYVAHLTGGGSEGALEGKGVYIEVKEEFWPAPKALDVGPAWTMMNGLQTYTASKDSEDWMRLESEGKAFMERTGIRAVPILKALGSSIVYCVDEEGKIGLFVPGMDLRPVEGTFWDIFEQELKALAERKEKMLAGEAQ